MSNDWERTSLGEIARIKQGTTIAVTKLSGGHHPVYGANGVVGWHSEANIHEPTVSLGCRGSCGTVYLAPSGAFLANNAMGVSPADSRSMVEFLALLLENADLRGNGVISGQVQEQITRKSLSALPIQLPPIDQQRRIVNVVNSVDQFIFNVEKQFKFTSTARSAVLSDLLAASEVESQPASLGDVMFSRPGKYLEKSRYSSGGQFRVYGSNSVMGSHTEALYEGPLVVMAGIGAYAGAVRFSEESCWVNNNAFAIFGTEKARVDWLYLWLQAKLDLNLVRRATAQPYVDKSALAAHPLDVPSLDVQERIVGVVGEMDQQIQALNRLREAAQLVRSGVASSLIHGEVLLLDDYDMAVER